MTGREHTPSNEPTREELDAQALRDHIAANPTPPSGPKPGSEKVETKGELAPPKTTVFRKPDGSPLIENHVSTHILEADQRPQETRPVTGRTQQAREKLRRAAEDGERLYRVRMHAPNGPTIADDNRIDGILSLELLDALGAYDALSARVAKLEGVIAIAEQGLDNIARLAALNAEEPGWQVEVHRIACECWRQSKDALRVPDEAAKQEGV